MDDSKWEIFERASRLCVSFSRLLCRSQAYLLCINNLSAKVIIFLYVLVMIHFAQNVIVFLICDKSLRWVLNLNLNYETLWNGVRVVLCFDRSNNYIAFGMKMYGFVLDAKSSYKMLRMSLSSKFNWCSYIVTITLSPLHCHPLMHNVPKWSDTLFLSENVARFLKCVWPFWDVMH